MLMNACLRWASFALTCLFILFLFASSLNFKYGLFVVFYSKDSRARAVCNYIGFEMTSGARAPYNSDCGKSNKHFSLCLKEVTFITCLFFFFSGQSAFTCPVFFCFIGLLYLHNSFLQLYNLQLIWHEAVSFWIKKKKICHVVLSFF